MSDSHDHGAKGDHGHHHHERGYHGPSLENLLKNPYELAQANPAVFGYREFPEKNKPANKYPTDTITDFRSQVKAIANRYDTPIKNLEKEINTLLEPYHLTVFKIDIISKPEDEVEKPRFKMTPEIKDLMDRLKKMRAAQRRELLGVVAEFKSKNKDYDPLTDEEKDALEAKQNREHSETAALEAQIEALSQKLNVALDKFKQESSIGETIKKLRSAGITDQDIQHKVIAKARQLQAKGKTAISGFFENLGQRIVELPVGRMFRFLEAKNNRPGSMGLSESGLEALREIAETYLTAGLGNKETLFLDPPEDPKDHYQLELAIMRAKIISLDLRSTKYLAIKEVIDRIVALNERGEVKKFANAQDVADKNLLNFLCDRGLTPKQLAPLADLFTESHPSKTSHSGPHDNHEHADHHESSDTHHSESEINLDILSLTENEELLFPLIDTPEYHTILGIIICLDEAYEHAIDSHLDITEHNEAVAKLHSWYDRLDNILEDRNLKNQVPELLEKYRKQRASLNLKNSEIEKAAAAIEEAEEEEIALEHKDMYALNNLLSDFKNKNYNRVYSQAMLPGPAWLYLLAPDYIHHTLAAAAKEPKRYAARRDRSKTDFVSSPLAKALIKFFKEKSVNPEEFSRCLPSATDLAIAGRFRDLATKPLKGDHPEGPVNIDAVNRLVNFYGDWTKSNNLSHQKDVENSLNETIKKYFSPERGKMALKFFKQVKELKEAPTQQHVQSTILAEKGGRLYMVGDKIPPFLTEHLGTTAAVLGVFEMDGSISNISTFTIPANPHEGIPADKLANFTIKANPESGRTEEITRFDARLDFEQSPKEQSRKLMTFLAHPHLPSQELRDLILTNAIDWAKKATHMTEEELHDAVSEIVTTAQEDGLKEVKPERFPDAKKLASFFAELGLNAISFRIFGKEHEIGPEHLANLAVVDNTLQGAIIENGTTYPFKGDEIIKQIHGFDIFEFKCTDPSTISGKIVLNENGVAREHSYINNAIVRMPLDQIFTSTDKTLPLDQRRIDSSRLQSDANLWFGFDGSLEGQVTLWGGDTYSVIFNSASLETAPYNATPEQINEARQIAIKKLEILRSYREAGERLMRLPPGDSWSRYATRDIINLISDLIPSAKFGDKKIWVWGEKNTTANQFDDYTEMFLQRFVLDGIIAPFETKPGRVVPTPGAVGFGNFSKNKFYRILMSSEEWKAKQEEFLRLHTEKLTEESRTAQIPANPPLEFSQHTEPTEYENPTPSSPEFVMQPPQPIGPVEDGQNGGQVIRMSDYRKSAITEDKPRLVELRDLQIIGLINDILLETNNNFQEELNELITSSNENFTPTQIRMFLDNIRFRFGTKIIPHEDKISDESLIKFWKQFYPTALDYLNNQPEYNNQLDTKKPTIKPEVPKPPARPAITPQQPLDTRHTTVVPTTSTGREELVSPIGVTVAAMDAVKPEILPPTPLPTPEPSPTAQQPEPKLATLESAPETTTEPSVTTLASDLDTALSDVVDDAPASADENDFGGIYNALADVDDGDYSEPPGTNANDLNNIAPDFSDIDDTPDAKPLSASDAGPTSADTRHPESLSREGLIDKLVKANIFVTKDSTKEEISRIMSGPAAPILEASHWPKADWKKLFKRSLPTLGEYRAKQFEISADSFSQSLPSEIKSTKEFASEWPTILSARRNLKGIKDPKRAEEAYAELLIQLNNIKGRYAGETSPAEPHPDSTELPEPPTEPITVETEAQPETIPAILAASLDSYTKLKRSAGSNPDEFLVGLLMMSGDQFVERLSKESAGSNQNMRAWIKKHFEDKNLPESYVDDFINRLPTSELLSISKEAKMASSLNNPNDTSILEAFFTALATKDLNDIDTLKEILQDNDSVSEISPTLAEKLPQLIKLSEEKELLPTNT